MSHFLRFATRFAIAGLASGMIAAALTACLVADRSTAERLPSRDHGTPVRAIDLAAITEATDQREGSTQGASEAAKSRNLRRYAPIPARVSGRRNRLVTRSKVETQGALLFGLPATRRLVKRSRVAAFFPCGLAHPARTDLPSLQGRLLSSLLSYLQHRNFLGQKAKAVPSVWRKYDQRNQRWYATLTGEISIVSDRRRQTPKESKLT